MRRRVLALAGAGVAATGAAVVLTFAFGAGNAWGSATETCSAASSILTINISGTPGGSDSLVVTTSSGDYVITYNGTAICTGTTYSDSTDPTVQVTEASGLAVPATFQPGSDAGVTFEGPANSNNSLDATSVGASAQISFTGSTAGSGTVHDSKGTDSFTHITKFVGASAGGTTFVAGSSGGYTLVGQGSGNTMDFSAVPSGIVANFLNGVVTLPGSQLDVFSGITGVVGSSSGENVFHAGATSETFADAGSVGHDLIDFSGVSASALTVNVSGSIVGGVANNTASTGLATYSFTSGGSNFSSFDGLASGHNDFVAGSSAGYSFNGEAPPNTLDLSGASQPATINLRTGSAQIGASGTDSFSNINNAIGPSGGNADFVLGGLSGDTVTGTGAGNSADFSADATGVTANLVTGIVQVAPNSTDAVSGISGVIGSAVGGNTFVAGASSETFSDPGSTGPDTVDFSNVATSGSAPLVVNVSGGPANSTANHTATVGTMTYTFTTGGSHFTTFDGATSGHNDFVAGATGGYTFTGHGSSNTLDLSGDASSITANLTTGSVQVAPSTTDSVSGVSSVIGSATGGNRFVPGSTSETFADPSSNGRDSIDFSAVTTTSSSPLSINVTGGPEASVANDTASVGSTTYSFTSGGSDFDSFTGASTGYTNFLAGSTGGYAFTGIGSQNRADFSADSSPLTANLATGVVTLGVSSDTVSGVTTLVGSADGDSTFVAENTGGYTLEGEGAGNTADFSGDPNAITADLPNGVIHLGAGLTDDVSGISAIVGSTVGDNTFDAGSTSETFADTGSGGADTVNFSAVTTSSGAPLTINVTGSNDSGVADHTAQVGASVYTFSTGAPQFLDFVGPTTGHADFEAAAAGGYTFSGNGSGNAADFGTDPDAITANTVSGVVQTGSGDSDSVAGVNRFVGSSGGGNTFLTDGSGGYDLVGEGAGNTADFSADADAITANLSTGDVEVDASATDTLADITTVVGTPEADTFSQTAAGTFAVQGGAGANVLDLSDAPNVTVMPSAASHGCDSGTYDGTAVGNGVDDTFQCVAQVDFNGAPLAPTATGALAGKGAIDVGWSDPTADGGSAITGYDVYCSTAPSPSTSGVPNATVSGATATSVVVTGLRNGTRYYCVVTAVNGNGSSAASNAVSAVPVGTPPVVLVTAPSAPISLASTATTHYSATDSNNAVASYDVRYETAKSNGGFGAWTYPKTWQATVATSQTLSASAGHEYCFSVRARDHIGNVSAWSTPRCTSRPLDDRSLSVKSSGWTRGRSAKAYLGTFTESKKSGAQLQARNVEADRLALVVTRCSTCGRLAIYLDGKLWRTVNTHASKTEYQQVISEPTFKLRKVTVELKDVSKGKPVYVDGLGVSRN